MQADKDQDRHHDERVPTLKCCHGREAQHRAEARRENPRCMNAEPTTQLPASPPLSSSGWFGAPRYRIVTDRWNGFEVQEWCWWWPFWRMPILNTSASVEDAKAWLSRHLNRGAQRNTFKSKVVEYIKAPNARTQARRG
jgi:hypothetical protein